VVTALGTLDCLEAPMPMIDAMKHKRPFAAWGLAALRFAHAVVERNTRVAAWATHALDDRTNAWQVGAGFDIAF